MNVFRMFHLRSKYICTLIVFIFITFFISHSIIWAEKIKLKKATFIPQWIPQAQFAGYYMALYKGIYKKYGIDLTIINGGPDRPSDVYLKDRKADFATMWLSTAIIWRSKGLELVNIAQIIQKSSLMFVAKKSSGIRCPRDLNGKRVGLWGPMFQVQPKAFFNKFGIKIIPVRQSYSVDPFLRGAVDATTAMWYNEYHTILMSGIDPNELTTFFFYKYGLNFPEDGIYVLEDTLKRHPKLCESFVKASIEGWMYAFSHPNETVNVVLENLYKAHIPANRAHQRWMLDRMKDLIIPKDIDRKIGVLNKKDYIRVANILKKQGLISYIPNFDKFYCNLINKNRISK